MSWITIRPSRKCGLRQGGPTFVAIKICGVCIIYLGSRLLYLVKLVNRRMLRDIICNLVAVMPILYGRRTLTDPTSFIVSCQNRLCSERGSNKLWWQQNWGSTDFADGSISKLTFNHLSSCWFLLVVRFLEPKIQMMTIQCHWKLYEEQKERLVGFAGFSCLWGFCMPAFQLVFGKTYLALELLRFWGFMMVLMGFWVARPQKISTSTYSWDP